jgi:hypothetical protein
MSYIKAHFDGDRVVLDEPASLAVGQQVRVVTESAKAASGPHFTPLVDMTATLMSGDEWDESTALHVDPLDMVPSDFVRHPGSAAGQIKMADDFNATPDEFEEYV